MPFLDRLELAAVAGMSDRSACHVVAALERRGLAASLAHATDLPRTTRRCYLTAAGLQRLAQAEGVGVVRQGRTADRTAFAKRLWRLREGPRLSGVLLLMPDAVRLQHARRRLADAPRAAFLALERDAIWGGLDHPVRRRPTINAIVDLPSALAAFDSDGALLVEPVPTRAPLPEEIERKAPGQDAPDWLLPVLLKPAEKRALDLLSDWPWISQDDLRGLLGVSQALRCRSYWPGSARSALRPLSPPLTAVWS